MFTFKRDTFSKILLKAKWLSPEPINLESLDKIKSPKQILMWPHGEKKNDGEWERRTFFLDTNKLLKKKIMKDQKKF